MLQGLGAGSGGMGIGNQPCPGYMSAGRSHGRCTTAQRDIDFQDPGFETVFMTVGLLTSAASTNVIAQTDKGVPEEDGCFHGWLWVGPAR